MKKMILIFAVLTVVFSSCRKDLTEQEELASTKTMVDLTIDDNFNWKTTKDIQVKLSGTETALVLVKSTEGATYHKGLLTADVDYSTKITLPTYVKEVEIAYDEQVYKLTIDNNKIEYTFN